MPFHAGIFLLRPCSEKTRRSVVDRESVRSLCLYFYAASSAFPFGHIDRTHWDQAYYLSLNYFVIHKNSTTFAHLSLESGRIDRMDNGILIFIL